MKKEKNGFGNIAKCLCFLVIALAILKSTQDILTPDWRYPLYNEAPADKMEEFYEIAKEADVQVQAIFVGPSHMEFAVNPMEIYQKSSIVSFNLSSAMQPISVSYALCSEMFDREIYPKVVVLDASGLFYSDLYIPAYRYILDNMALGKSKIQLAQSFALEYPEDKQLGAFLGAFFPLYEYHDRWSELSSFDFEACQKMNLYRKGYYILSQIVPSEMDVSTINNIADLLQSNIGQVHILDNGVPSNHRYGDALYAAVINDTARYYLFSLKQLCEENGTKLVLTKIPTIGAPQYYSSSWTKTRAAVVKKLAKEYKLEFVDLCYDTALEIDWTKDTRDGGIHLNYTGANKVSTFFADYLENQCALEGKTCKTYDMDISIYNTVCQLADLQTIADLPTYLSALSQFNDITVFFSAADDMVSNLTQELQSALKNYGLQTEFDTLEYRDSFIAIKESGNMLYEASSNRRIDYQSALTNGSTCSLVSSGWLTVSDSEICIDGTEYSMNQRGLNIVVFDNASKMVLDSVAFDTCISGAPPAVRKNSHTEKYLREYEQYLMIQSAKNDGGVSSHY